MNKGAKLPRESNGRRGKARTIRVTGHAFEVERVDEAVVVQPDGSRWLFRRLKESP